MTQYVQQMASVADGFRLDNTHSTPIHVCQYLLQAARSKNKNLFVMAELFTNSPVLDALFCQKLNLNGMVREFQNRYDTGSTGAYFHHLTCQKAVLGQIDSEFTDVQGRKYSVLKATSPVDIIYDCTHDNPSVVEKFQTGRMALPHLGLGALSDTSIASTWGYDVLVGKQIHCVTEKRTYPLFDQSDILAKTPSQPQKAE
jgi:glycogen debranching enzyme